MLQAEGTLMATMVMCRLCHPSMTVPIQDPKSSPWGKGPTGDCEAHLSGGAADHDDSWASRTGIRSYRIPPSHSLNTRGSS